MIQIARMHGDRQAFEVPSGSAKEEVLSPASGHAADYSEKQAPNFTIEKIDCPACLVNYNFQLEWCNNAAEQLLFGPFERFSDNIEERNVFQILLNESRVRQHPGFEDILRFHLSLARNRLPESRLLIGNVHIVPEDMDRLIRLYDEVDAAGNGPIIRSDTDVSLSVEESGMRQMYACIFREGILIVYMPASDESLLSYLSGRASVIRDLLKKRRPFLTPLAVLVADLQDAVRICAELPPDEYFELINTIWRAMQPLLRKYYATCGKHAGDGMVYYFFPQPEHSYQFNALCFAQEMRESMRDISRQWRRRKNWLNELQLNIGLEEGEEWFGTYQTATQLEMTVLGKTANRAVRLSEFACNGSIWASKNLLGKLSRPDREKIHHGIHRRAGNGQEIFLPHSYSRISDLIDPDKVKNGKLHDISDLAVTEVLDVNFQPE